MGTHAFALQRAESFRRAPGLKPVLIVFYAALKRRSFTVLHAFSTGASRRILEAALEWVRRGFRLQVCEYVVILEQFICSSANRDRMSGDRNGPLKPKDGLNGAPAKFLVSDSALRADSRFLGDTTAFGMTKPILGSRASYGAALTRFCARLAGALAGESSRQLWSGCGALSGFRFAGTWSFRSMFICCSTSRDGMRPAIEMAHSSQRTA